MNEYLTHEVIARIPSFLFREQDDGWIEARTSLSRNQTPGYRKDSTNGTAIAGLIDMAIVAACKIQFDVKGPTYNFGPKKIRFHIPPEKEIIVRAKVSWNRLGVCHVKVEILDNDRTILCYGSGNLKEDKPRQQEKKNLLLFLGGS